MPLNSLSQVDRAFRDTTIRKSTGPAFRLICRHYGIPWDRSIPEASWRAAVRANALGPRGTPGAVLQFVEAVLGQWSTVIPCSIDPATPSRLTADTPGAFTQAHVGRWVRLSAAVGGGLYHVSGPSDIATSSGDWVTLNPVGTAYWASSDGFSSLAGVTDVEATVLAWTAREPSPSRGQPHPQEKRCLYEVFVYEDSFYVPPTYMQTSGARPAGEPFGGQVQANEISEAGDQVDGPFPPYLTGGGVLQTTQGILDALMAAGCRVTLQRVEL